MIRFDHLWTTMEARGLTQYRLIKHYNFSAGQIGRLKKNMHVSTHTLDTLCSILECNISDIIEYIPEGLPLTKPEEVPVKKSVQIQKKDPQEMPVKQKKAEAPKGDKQKKAGKSKKGDKKTAKEIKKGKESKKGK